ncbi:MAG: hypothetical protein OXU71_09860, partial [Gammaproteobacteria bacterium]|nr:hypothetical protein [Gammaproteobacteria bacterium]
MARATRLRPRLPLALALTVALGGAVLATVFIAAPGATVATAADSATVAAEFATGEAVMQAVFEQS